MLSSQPNVYKCCTICHHRHEDIVRQKRVGGFYFVVFSNVWKLLTYSRVTSLIIGDWPKTSKATLDAIEKPFHFTLHITWLVTSSSC